MAEAAELQVRFGRPESKETNAMMTDRDSIVVTTADRQRLGSLLIDAERLGLVERRYLDDLTFELERAAAVDPHEAA